MRTTGISIFTGMEYTVEDNLRYIEKASSKGFKRIFTSMQRPGSDPSRVSVEMPIITKKVKELGMEIVTDISPRALTIFKATLEDLSPFRDAGVTGLRLDDGFSNKQAAELTHNKAGLKIELNACHYFDPDLDEMLSCGADVKNLQASFNYYPRFESGISLDFLRQQASAFSRHGIPVFAFVHSSDLHTRVTVESQRYMSPERAAEELFAVPGIDTVLIGDPMASDRDLDAVAETGSRDYVKIRAVIRRHWFKRERYLLYANQLTAKPGTMLSLRHTYRFPPEEMHRMVPPHNCIARREFSVTIDNEKYRDGNNNLKNSCELNIWFEPMAADERINVVASIVEEDRNLVRMVRPFQKFKLAPFE
ncbi:MAG: MupG family TIM beta-alpha barrel fold protein [Candidatus Thermoplasmatota archaeon]|nr:MupG family TIM beta-alpha barrel fold protein [Candidatus Thermoplasmatota archaeon]